MSGKLYGKNSLFLRVAVGTAQGEGDDAGDQYEMSLVNGHTMAVRNGVTGKTFVANWQDLIAEAKAAGIDNMEDEE